ncbi:MAG TPA: Rrf2 family transcriptional regulator [Rhizomicrobium sp.]|jgi:Rrf2 family protein|nr:Rrf2 family transcriptional regulator [Rhizomicrobium sp.]
MLSQKARYALHALILLAEQGGREPMMIADIAEQSGAPRKFLEQILLSLKRRGIVQSVRGRAGGYRLGRPAKEISFADIIRETDGPLALSPCVSVTAYHKCADCKDEATCAIRKALLAARDATAAVLESRTLAQAAAGARRARSG